MAMWPLVILSLHGVFGDCSGVLSGDDLVGVVVSSPLMEARRKASWMAIVPLLRLGGRLLLVA